jgi:SAM-dependent methyltransferase
MPTATNSQSVRDDLWAREGLETWRKYPGPFGRISWLLASTAKETQEGQTPRIVDLGCGVGVLLNQVHEAIPGSSVGVGIDISPVACQEAMTTDGVAEATPGDLMDPNLELPTGDILLCTETLEHLEIDAVRRILEHSKSFAKSFFMVPNNCLGPEVEPQHMRQWTAKEFLDLLREYHGADCRVECFFHQPTFVEHGHRGYLLGVCGYKKFQTMSFTMPVKDEGEDIERVLSSFRGACDEMIIGIDDKTTDDSEEIARHYADEVFHFTWENDFSAARNHGIDKCTCDWIFMSEGHEHLHEGIQALLQLEDIQDGIKVLEVRRESRDSSWYFPWLFRNHQGIRFEFAVHNELAGFDHEKESGMIPQVATWHEQSLKKQYERSIQRRGMNKQELIRRVKEENSIRDMYYLGAEYRDLMCPTCKGHRHVPDEEASNGEQARMLCPDCTIELSSGEKRALGIRPMGIRQSVYWFERFIEACKPGIPLRYQARLSLAAQYMVLGRIYEAKRILAEAVVDDATRTEHWIVLGDLCVEQGQPELAMRFYEYASVGIGRPPLTHTFVEKAVYTYLPAQKLTSIYAELGMWESALDWVGRIPDLMPDWTPQAALDEVEAYRQQIEAEVTQLQNAGSN